MAKKLLITVIVLSTFQDKFDHKTQYPEGTELKVDKERADDLVSRGLAKVKEVKEPEDKKEENPPKDAGAAKVEDAGAKAAAGDNPDKTTKDDGKGTEE